MILDQTLHFLWAFLAVLPLALTRRTRYLSHLALAWLTLNGGLIVLREVNQWPTSRPWDPWLDWAFFALGAAAGLGVAAWRRRPR